MMNGYFAYGGVFINFNCDAIFLSRTGGSTVKKDNSFAVGFRVVATQVCEIITELLVGVTSNIV